MSAENGTIDRAELAQAIEKDRQERAQACQAAIAQALEEHNCTMQPQITITGAQIQAGITIQAQ